MERLHPTGRRYNPDSHGYRHHLGHHDTAFQFHGRPVSLSGDAGMNGTWRGRNATLDILIYDAASNARHSLAPGSALQSIERDLKVAPSISLRFRQGAATDIDLQRMEHQLGHG